MLERLGIGIFDPIYCDRYRQAAKYEDLESAISPGNLVKIDRLLPQMVGKEPRYLDNLVQVLCPPNAIFASNLRY